MNEWLKNSSSFIGLYHVDNNLPCQDNTITMTKNGCTIAVLSDGCGSAVYSEDGSRIVVNSISDYVADNFDKLYNLTDLEIKKTLISVVLSGINNFISLHKDMISKFLETKKGIKEHLEVLNNGLFDPLSTEQKEHFFRISLFDATMLVVAVKEDKCLVCHCGDGFIVGYKHGWFDVLSEENKQGDRNATSYPSTVNVKYLVTKNIKEYDEFRVAKFDKNEYLGFVLMSDGSEKSLIRFSKGPNVPISQNLFILFSILYNETESDAKQYITEQLEKVYRSVVRNGKQILISDDDVSLAVLLSSDCNLAEEKQSLGEYHKLEQKVSEEINRIIKIENEEEKESKLSTSSKAKRTTSDDSKKKSTSLSKPSSKRSSSIEELQTKYEKEESNAYPLIINLDEWILKEQEALKSYTPIKKGGFKYPEDYKDYIYYQSVSPSVGKRKFIKMIISIEYFLYYYKKGVKDYDLLIRKVRQKLNLNNNELSLLRTYLRTSKLIKTDFMGNKGKLIESNIEKLIGMHHEI